MNYKRAKSAASKGRSYIREATNIPAPIKSSMMCLLRNGAALTPRLIKEIDKSSSPILGFYNGEVSGVLFWYEHKKAWLLNSSENSNLSTHGIPLSSFSFSNLRITE